MPEACRKLLDSKWHVSMSIMYESNSEPETEPQELISMDPCDGVDLRVGVPLEIYDSVEQLVDFRTSNSWSLQLHEVSTVELLEVQTINTIGPFILVAKLKEMMTRIPDVDKFVVNVSAMEGQFYRYKTTAHPHTNMAKASLNMITRTSGLDFVKDRIYMTSVDTGWVTDERPIWKNLQRSSAFTPPLDITDGASRCVDPIFVALNGGVHHFGVFMKDYAVTNW